MTQRKFSSTDIAWFAGLFEGEGCAILKRDGTAQISIAMVDHDVIERANNYMGDRKIFTGSLSSGKPFYAATTARATSVHRILTAIYPYLGKRRQQQASKAIWGAERVLENDIDSKQRAILVKELYARGISRKELTNLCGVSRCTIDNVVTGRTKTLGLRKLGMRYVQ